MKGDAKRDPYLIARAQERRATLRRVLLECGAVVLLLIGAYWGYNVSNERHLLSIARSALEEHRLTEADQAARGLLEIAPGHLGALEVLASVQENLGSVEGLELRKQLAEAHPKQAEGWLKYAAVALNFQKWDEVQRALGSVPASAQGSERFQALSGEFNLAQGNAAAAERFYSEALKVAPTNTVYRCQLASARLRSSDPAIRERARTELEEGAKANPPLLPAIRALSRESQTRGDTAAALEVGIRLLSLPGRTGPDRTFIFNLLRKELKPEIALALKPFAERVARNEDEVALLMRWTFAHVRKLEPVPMPKSRPEYATCQYVAQNWGALLELTNNNTWSDFEEMRLAYRALARHQTGDVSAATLTWTQATLNADRQTANYQWLVEFARAYQWENAAEEALWSGADNAPDPNWALADLEKIYFSHADTAGLYRVLSRMSKLDPGNPRIQERLARVSLLIRRDVEQMKKTAAELYRQNPDELQHATLQAFVLMENGQVMKALGILDKFPAERFEESHAAAYYGLLLAANRKNDKARYYLELAQNGQLLNEEKELVTKALHALPPDTGDKSSAANLR